mgnify:CR=1 FL=1
MRALNPRISRPDVLTGVPLSELALLATAIIAGGIVTGILAGLFGIGGGAIIVPVLYEVFRALGVPEEVRIQLCIGTSLAIIVPTTIRSYQAHRATGIEVEGIVRLCWLPALIGVMADRARTCRSPTFTCFQRRPGRRKVISVWGAPPRMA